MERMEHICFTLIASAGCARSLYIEAIRQAKDQEFEKAYLLMDEGEKLFVEGHAAHAGLIQHEANGQNSVLSLLLLHAEDQLMSAETFGILAYEFIEIHKKIAEKR